MKTILVPIDYSPDSANALVFALNLGRLLEARIVLFHAFELPLTVPLSYQEMTEDQERDELERLYTFAETTRLTTGSVFIQKYHSTFGSDPEIAPPFPQTKTGFHTIEEESEQGKLHSIEIDYMARAGDFRRQIIDAAKEVEAGLIVMAIRHSGAISQAFMGSKVLEVIHESNVPVLAIASGQKFKGIKTVVLATDLMHMPHYSRLHNLHDFIKELGAELIVMHLFRTYNQQEERNELTPALEKLDVCFYDLDYKIYYQHQQDVAAGILEFIKEQKADLLVLVPQKHNFFHLMLSKSITGKLTPRLKIPLFALPASA